MTSDRVPPGPVTDDALIERIRAGDQRAWSALLDRYQGLIYAVPRRYGLSAEAAADVSQEVLLALLKGLPRLRDARALPRWLIQTAYRLSRDRRRRDRREIQPEDERFWGAQPDPGPSFEDQLAGIEAAAQVRSALAGISARCRALLEAMFLEDPPPAYAELARRFGLPVGSLGPTRQRCLERALAVLAPAAGKGARIRSRRPHTSMGKGSHRRTPPGADT